MLLAGRTQAPLTVKTVEPEARPTDVARIDQVIGTVTTHHAAGQPRVTNIHRMADVVDGAVVGPGETVSLSGMVGRRTLAGGVVSDGAIVNGELE